jgi:hypothetical protein
MVLEKRTNIPEAACLLAGWRGHRNAYIETRIPR